MIPNLTPEGFEWRYYPPTDGYHTGMWVLGCIQEHWRGGSSDPNFYPIYQATQEFMENVAPIGMVALIEQIFGVVDWHTEAAHETNPLHT